MEESGSLTLDPRSPAAPFFSRLGETRGWRQAPLDLHIHRELDLFLVRRRRDRHPFQLDVTPAHDIDNHRIEALARLPTARSPWPDRAAARAGTGGRKPERRGNRPPTECALRSESLRPPVRTDSPNRPIFRDAPARSAHRIGEFDLFQNLRAHQRMDLHLLELFGRQAARLGNDVFRDRQFADIVQQGGRLQSVQFVWLRPISLPISVA